MRLDDRDRHRAIDLLGRGYVAGSLGTQTFELRLDAAHRARTLRELRRLTADLPVRGWLHRVRDAIAARRERSPSIRVSPPPDGPGPWIVGRSSACQLKLDDDTISRRHLEVRRAARGWEVVDLGSTNGTWVNGWRVERATLRPGDVLYVGEIRVELS